MYKRQILKSVILAPKNDDCTFINTVILNRIPGEQKTYHSYDKIICDDAVSYTHLDVYKRQRSY